MTSFEFFELLSLYPFVYIIYLLISISVFLGIMKVTSSSWLNPIRFNIFAFSIGFSVLLFLNHCNVIKLATFVYTLVSIFIFWITFICIYRNKQIKVNVKLSDEPILAKYLFYASYIIYILFTLFSYKVLGIPIFNDDSRLATYTGSGLGFIARLSPVLYIYSIFYIIHLFFKYISFRRRIFSLLLLMPLIIFGVLSGSRSSFLGIIFVFWGYQTFFLQKEPKLLQFKWLIVPFILISIFTFSIQSAGNYRQAGFDFLNRVVSCGDLYWEALPNETWKSVIIHRPFEFTFMGLLGPLHILNPNLAETPIGFQLTNIIYPSIAGRSTGPVALFPVFGLVCFGYVGGLFFSFLQAILASFLFKLSFIKSNSIIVSAMAYYTFNNMIPLLADISSGLGSCLDIAVSYVFIAFLLSIIALFFYFGKDFISTKK